MSRAHIHPALAFHLHQRAGSQGPVSDESLPKARGPRVTALERNHADNLTVEHSSVPRPFGPAAKTLPLGWSAP